MMHATATSTTSSIRQASDDSQTINSQTTTSPDNNTSSQTSHMTPFSSMAKPAVVPDSSSTSKDEHHQDQDPSIANSPPPNQTKSTSNPSVSATSSMDKNNHDEEMFSPTSAAALALSTLHHFGAHQNQRQRVPTSALRGTRLFNNNSTSISHPSDATNAAASSSNTHNSSPPSSSNYPTLSARDGSDHPSASPLMNANNNNSTSVANAAAANHAHSYHALYSNINTGFASSSPFVGVPHRHYPGDLSQQQQQPPHHPYGQQPSPAAGTAAPWGIPPFPRSYSMERRGSTPSTVGPSPPQKFYSDEQHPTPHHLHTHHPHHHNLHHRGHSCPPETFYHIMPHPLRDVAPTPTRTGSFSGHHDSDDNSRYHHHQANNKSDNHNKPQARLTMSTSMVTPTPKKPKLMHPPPSTTSSLTSSNSTMASTKAAARVTPTDPGTSTSSSAIETSNNSSNSSVDGKNSASYSRKKKSLGVLAENFLRAYHHLQPEDTIVVDEAAIQLGVERRRIYDVVNILESICLVSKKHKNTYSWKGMDHLDAVFGRLQAQAILDYPEDAQALLGCPPATISTLKDHYTNNPELLRPPVPLKPARRQSSTNANTSTFPNPNENTNFTASSTSSKGRENKSLAKLSQEFLQVFLVGHETLSLPEASDKIQGTTSVEELIAIGGHPATKNEECHRVNHKELKAAAARGLKTKIRRLYDIANVFLSVGLLKKVESNDSSRRPNFSWSYRHSAKALYQLHHPHSCPQSTPQQSQEMLMKQEEITTAGSERGKSPSPSSSSPSSSCDSSPRSSLPLVKQEDSQSS